MIHVSAKTGKKYYLMRKLMQNAPDFLYLFAGTPRGADVDLPPVYKVVENPYNGVPFVKKRLPGEF